VKKRGYNERVDLYWTRQPRMLHSEPAGVAAEMPPASATSILVGPLPFSSPARKRNNATSGGMQGPQGDFEAPQLRHKSRYTWNEVWMAGGRRKAASVMSVIHHKVAGDKVASDETVRLR
jgi:hypothetical protein